MTYKITKLIAAELASHEGIVREAYKDSVGVWTWGIGVTSSSGHKVWPRYVDRPQTIAKCFEVYEWLLRTRYTPDVKAAFGGALLTENQFGAALSFHYNTGGIDRASWVRSFNAGEMAKAKLQFMNWSKPPEIVKRRKKERDLFFSGKWTSRFKITAYPVRKPSYNPDFGDGKVFNIEGDLDAVFSN